MNSLRRWLAGLVPAPLAAPETTALRWARLSLLGALSMLGAITLFWRDLVVVVGVVAAGLVAALVGYIVVLMPFWLLAKHKADSAWLARVTCKDSDPSGGEAE